MHVAQLRRELDDKLFTRTASGLAFTPGGLRLASRAVEILGLQDRTVREVSQAGHGRRLLRMAASSLFAEHAAPGLIELFAGRADDLDVELSVRPGRAVRRACSRRARSTSRSARRRAGCRTTLVQQAVPELRGARGGRPGPPAGRPPGDRRRRPARRPGCSARRPPATRAWCPAMLRQPRRPRGAASGSSRATRPRSRRPSARDGDRPGGAVRGRRATWPPAGWPPSTARACAPRAGGRRWRCPRTASSPATAELLRFITTPRATQAMVHGAGVNRRPVQAVGARHALELGPPVRIASSASVIARARVRGQEGVAERQRRRHRADQRLEPRRRGPRVEPDHPVRAQPDPGQRRREQRPGRRCPSRRRRSPARRRAGALPCREASSSREAAGQVGAAVPVDDLLGGLRHRHRGASGAAAPGSAGSARSRTRTSRPGPVRASARIRCRYAVGVAAASTG